MDVRLDPAGGLHVGDRFRIAVHTAGEAGDKDIRGDRLPGDAVSNSQGAAGPVHFHEFAGFPADPQRCLFGGSVGMVLFIELGVLIGDHTGSLAFRAVLCPQECEGHVGLREFFINVFIIRHKPPFPAGASRIQDLFQIPVGKGGRDRPGQPLFLDKLPDFSDSVS